MGAGKGPLAGLKVVDFGQYIAGPAVAMILADQGAEVIRVEAPGGPFWDTPANAILNRGKRSIRLDLKDESGDVHVEPWDHGEVELRAETCAPAYEDLNAVKVAVDALAEHLDCPRLGQPGCALHEQMTIGQQGDE